MQKLTLITPASGEPISLAELKAQARVTTTAEDSVLTIAIAAARAKAENYTGRALMAQTWRQNEDAFPDAEIELLKPPVRAIGSVTYIDVNGATQTLSNTLYTLDAAAYPGWLLPAYNTDWPSTQASANAVAIQYDCGYADAASVPADIKMWLLMTAAFIFAQREAMVLDGKVAEIPGRFIDSLLDPYRIFKV